MSLQRAAVLVVAIGCCVASTPGGAQTQTLKVTLLGTGSPRPLLTRFGPSTLVEAGAQKILIDCGRGATQRLFQQLNIPLSQITSVFITHLHSDHIMGVPDLWLSGWLATPFGRRVEPLEVYGPAGTREAMSHFEKAFQVDIRSRIEDEKLPPRGGMVIAKDIAEGPIFEKDGLKITAFNVDHAEAIQPALGFRIDYAGRSAVISGDTRFSENLIKFATGADVVIHEVTAAKDELLRQDEAQRRILANHTSPQDAGKLFERVKPKLAVYTHVIMLGPAASGVTIPELIAMTRQTYKGPLEVGEDLMAITIGDTVDVQRAVERR